jgi:ribosomal protein S28E/S33
MTGKKEEIDGIPPGKVMQILKEKASAFTIRAGEDDNVQEVECRILESGADAMVYEYRQFFPGKLLKIFQIRIRLAPKGKGTVGSIDGKLLRTEAPPGTVIEGGGDARHEATTLWTYLKNLVIQEINAGRVDEIERVYNAGPRELFQMLKDPSLLTPAMYLTNEKDPVNGSVTFQDPSGSLVFLIRRTGLEEPNRLKYHMESNTSNMWIRTGDVELSIEKINEAKSRLIARAVPGPTEVAEQMKMSAMYLPAEQLQGYLSFRQDLGMLMGWIEAAVPIHIPHIRDMIVVQGDFVAGGKVEIKDSVVNRANIQTGAMKDDGKYIVHAGGQTGDKVTVKDSVVHRTDIGSGGKSLEVYRKSMEAAFQDGRIDDSEATLLESLQSSLGITPEEHLSVLEGLGVLEKDAVKQYCHVLGATLADGKIDDSEAAVLETLRKQYGIPLVIHRALCTKLGHKG